MPDPTFQDDDFLGTSSFDPQTGTGACQLPRICGSGGHRRWSMRRGKDGNREYTLKYRVETSYGMGPFAALYAPGLPVPGSAWNFGTDEYDFWAYCTQDVQVDQVLGDGEPNNYFDLIYTFTTTPQDTCFTEWQDDPVLRPAKVSGNFVRYNEPATVDRLGEPILSSSWERITGPQVEFDANRPQIHIELWAATLDLPFLCEYIDGVNDLELWGFPERSVKFSACTWSKMFRPDCSCVYRLVYEFDVNVKTDPLTLLPITGFDRSILDEGTKVLKGKWDATKGFWRTEPVGVRSDGSLIWPDPANPSHFMRYTDPNANVTRIILNGAGLPWNPDHYTTGTATASLGTSDDEKGYIYVEKYVSRDLTLLGIPLTLECE